jgi:hypothetical protein
MTHFFPIIELVDRYVIAKLKFDKTQGANVDELDFYSAQMESLDMSLIESELTQLYNIHKAIWSLEAELKSGREHELELAEIGHRAIEIRNFNHQRIALKNLMADKLGKDLVHEIKREHLSE